jgi:hypothetical protein
MEIGDVNHQNVPHINQKILNKSAGDGTVQEANERSFPEIGGRRNRFDQHFGNALED